MSTRPGDGTHRRKNRGRPTMRRSDSHGRSAAPTHARLLALRVLERVQRAKAYADVLLHSSLASTSLAASDRAFATELVCGTLRWRGRIDYLLGHLLDRDLEKLEPMVATALRLGAYQILFTDGVPASAAVDESVRCVRAAGAERATGLVNAVLRRLATEHASIPLPTLEEDPVGHLSHCLSLPEWIARRWIELYGPEAAAALARTSNNPPPLTVRANRTRNSPAELLADIRERFHDATPCRFASDGIVLGRRGNPAVDPAFRAGRFSVQDEAAQLVVALLDPAPGDDVLDVCAAPGGKTSAIAERLGDSGSVLAIDRHASRLNLVRRESRRLGLDTIRSLQRDATHSLSDIRPEGGFDRVLVDVPCSGLGTLRRNPDARWRIEPRDPGRLAEVQRDILRNAAATLRPGGVLVYSTCTLLPEENEAVVSAFLDESPQFECATEARIPDEARPVVAPDGFLRCLPHIHDTDGFFAARLERRT